MLLIVKDVLIYDLRNFFCSILLNRLLYGRLQRRSGFGMSGKSSLTARRNIIMQFLGQCSNEEMKTFVSLITDPLILYKGIFTSFTFFKLYYTYYHECLTLLEW